MSDSGAPLVELRDVGIYYRAHRKRRVSLRQFLASGQLLSPPPLTWALRHVDLCLHDGQRLGIVGPNGAGKSTLCLLLARILSADEGEANVRGKVATLLSLGRGFNDELTGRENIRLYAAFIGIPRAELARRMDEIIAFTELGEAIDEPVSHYSSGMRARLAFSVATALEPEILILDEILAVGDRAFQAKSEARILDLMSASRLIAIVSHSSDFLRSVCTHALWLERGRVVRFGPAREVLDAYDSASDARGAPPVRASLGVVR